VIQIEPLGHVSIIRLDRPDKRNAQTPKMLANLAAAIDRAMSAHAIVLSGVGEVFCAGFDLTLCREDDAVLGDLLTGLARAVWTIRQAPCPVVVSSHGAAIAGGCALAAAGDIVVTNKDAKLGYPVVRLGISPAVNAPTLRATVGEGPARTRQLDPALIDGAEALRVGLAHHCVDTVAQCEPLAVKLAQELERKPRLGLAYTKRWLGQLDGTLDHARLDEGLRTSMDLVGSAEQRERLAELWKGDKGR
jgi:enoyl-CoA hydratase/carnithine racemase